MQIEPHYGLTPFRGGGAWNNIWKEFHNKYQNVKGRPYFVLGFGFGLLERVLPALTP
jgi:hypothetical protein